MVRGWLAKERTESNKLSDSRNRAVSVGGRISRHSQGRRRKVTAQEFQLLLTAKGDRDLLGTCLRDDFVPYVFEPAPASWVSFRSVLVSDLGVNPGDIAVVGSGRLGFSLKPRNNFKIFSERSDIDVIIVNHELFDWLWLALLEAAYPRPPVTEEDVGGWLKKLRYEVYTGWMSPLKIQLDHRIYGRKAKPVSEFNTRWFNSFKNAAQHPPRRHKTVSARLYQSWQHADLYHLNSLSELRKSIAEGA
jgi:hypothetical protein